MVPLLAPFAASGEKNLERKKTDQLTTMKILPNMFSCVGPKCSILPNLSAADKDNLSEEVPPKELSNFPHSCTIPMRGKLNMTFTQNY